MKEYKVGEIFRFYNETVQCVHNSHSNGYCNTCEMPKVWCESHPCRCFSADRSDNTSVHYVKVNEPKEGMLFRASDGKLYELRDMTKIPIKEIYNCSCVKGALPCAVIDDEIFGKSSGTLLHWYPVDEHKMVVKYTKGE